MFQLFLHVCIKYTLSILPLKFISSILPLKYTLSILFLGGQNFVSILKVYFKYKKSILFKVFIMYLKYTSSILKFYKGDIIDVIDLMD